MTEYLICTDDDDGFDLHLDRWPEVMRPNTVASEPVEGWGNHRIRVEGVEISFADEAPGIQVVIEGDMPKELSRRVVEEVLDNIEKATGQEGWISLITP